MKRGQGLLETIIALAVIMTGLVSVISLTISNLSNARDTAKRYIAVNLAREGIELVRNLRDSNWLAGQGAWEGITAGDARALQFDPGGSASVVAGLPGSEQIAQCDDGTYAQGTVRCSGATPFSRTLSLQLRSCEDAMADDTICGRMVELGTLGAADAAVALEVTSTVSWQDAGQAKRITLSETFYDWR